MKLYFWINLIIMSLVVLILETTRWSQDNNIKKKLTTNAIIELKIDTTQIEKLSNAITSLKNNDKKWYELPITFIISTILSLFLGIFADKLKKRFFNMASIDLIFDKNDNRCVRKFIKDNQINDIDYRLKVYNKSKKIIASKCSTRISLNNIHPNEIVSCDSAYIKNKSEFTSITDEYILWDFNYKGENPYSHDVLPLCHDMIAFVKFRNHNSQSPYWEIPSENTNKPKICLSSKNLYFTLTVYGENIKPTSIDIKLDMPI